MDTIARAGIAPQLRSSCTVRRERQVFRDRSPAASLLAMITLAQIDHAFVATGRGPRDQWRNQRPLVVDQIAPDMAIGCCSQRLAVCR
jgi:hypothetical protein